MWEHLQSITFNPTKHFKELKIDPTAKEIVLSRKAPRAQLSTIIVDIAYGGRAMKCKLTIDHVPIDKQGRQWSLDPTDVDRMLDDRLIHRSDAAKLGSPQILKR